MTGSRAGRGAGSTCGACRAGRAALGRPTNLTLRLMPWAGPPLGRLTNLTLRLMP